MNSDRTVGVLSFLSAVGVPLLFSCPLMKRNRKTKDLFFLIIFIFSTSLIEHVREVNQVRLLSGYTIFNGGQNEGDY